MSECARCGNDPCTCQRPEALESGQSLRLNHCDVPGCPCIVSAGNPDRNLDQLLRFLTRCRFHRDPHYHDPARLPKSQVIPDIGPLLTFDQVKEDFERIKQAARKELMAYWQIEGITVRRRGNATR